MRTYAAMGWQASVSKNAQRVAARMGFTPYLALSPQWQPLEVLHAWPLG